MDDTRPMLICRQVHASVNRATLHHPHRGIGGRPATYQHVELALDLAASPLCNQMYKYAWPSLPSVDVAMTLVLEGRTADELPERHVASFAVNGVEPTEVAPQPKEWPAADGSDVPGELFGARGSGRSASDPGSWQSTRAVIDEAKAQGGRSPPPSSRLKWGMRR